MIKGKTKSGFNYHIDENVLQDYELLEAIAETEKNPIFITKVVRMLLGDDTDKLKEHVRDENGHVSIEKMNVEITEIFQSQKKLKK
ncbi:MAG: hypothetical protein D8B48_08760 [Granulicatella sp.]|nr:MAG: hypothetical protein D8B48_08760 [Granulicatella sp.]